MIQKVLTISEDTGSISIMKASCLTIAFGLVLVTLFVSHGYCEKPLLYTPLNLPMIYPDLKIEFWRKYQRTSVSDTKEAEAQNREWIVPVLSGIFTEKFFMWICRMPQPINPGCRYSMTFLLKGSGQEISFSFPGHRKEKKSIMSGFIWQMVNLSMQLKQKE